MDRPQLRTAPLFFFALWLACGVVVFDNLPALSLLGVLGLLGLVGAVGYCWWVLGRRMPFVEILFFVLGFFVLGYVTAWVHRVEPLDAALDRAHYYRAHVVETPKRSKRWYSCVARVDACMVSSAGGDWVAPLSMVPTQALVQLRGYDLQFAQVGDEFWIKGAPRRLDLGSNVSWGNMSWGNVSGYETYLIRQGIDWRHVVQSKNMAQTDRIRGNALWRWSQQIRTQWQQRLRVTLSPSAAAMAQALLLGDKQDIYREHMQAFSTIGVMHLFAVSGLHVGLIYGFVYGMFFFLSFLFPQAVLWRHGAALIGAGLFVLIIGMPVSAMRAWLMLLLFVCASLLNRRVSSFNLLGLAVLILLLSHPDTLFSLSFQLSFLAVLGILCTYAPLVRVIRQRSLSTVALTLSAQAFTFPLTIHYFYTVPLYGLLSNVWLVPMLFVALPWAMLVGILGKVPGFSVLNIGLDHLLQWMQDSVLWVQGLPYSYLYPLYWDHTQVVLVYVLLLSAWMYWPLRQLWLRVAFVLGVALWVGYGVWLSQRNFDTHAWVAVGNASVPSLYYFDHGFVWTNHSLRTMSEDRSSSPYAHTQQAPLSGLSDVLIRRGWWHALGAHPLRPLRWHRISSNMHLAFMGNDSAAHTASDTVFGRIVWLSGKPTHRVPLRPGDVVLLSDAAKPYLKYFDTTQPSVCVVVNAPWERLPVPFCLHVLDKGQLQETQRSCNTIYN